MFHVPVLVFFSSDHDLKQKIILYCEIVVLHFLVHGEEYCLSPLLWKQKTGGKALPEHFAMELIVPFSRLFAFLFSYLSVKVTIKVVASTAFPVINSWGGIQVNHPTTR